MADPYRGVGIVQTQRSPTSYGRPKSPAVRSVPVQPVAVHPLVTPMAPTAIRQHVASVPYHHVSPSSSMNSIASFRDPRGSFTLAKPHVRSSFSPTIPHSHSFPVSHGAESSPTTNPQSFYSPTRVGSTLRDGSMSSFRAPRGSPTNPNQRPSPVLGAPGLCREIIRQLQEGYDCAICCENIARQAPVWNCGNCFRIFHLGCIQKWANVGGFRCPGCQSQYDRTPSVYTCFCGKTRNPIDDPYGIPHSCGQACRKTSVGPLCAHPCPLVCHPGPCRKCEPCYCGKSPHNINNLSDTDDGRVCASDCSRLLPCGRHTCRQRCHIGPCPPCEEDTWGNSPTTSASAYGSFVNQPFPSVNAPYLQTTPQQAYPTAVITPAPAPVPVPVPVPVPSPVSVPIDPYSQSVMSPTTVPSYTFPSIPTSPISAVPKSPARPRVVQIQSPTFEPLSPLSVLSHSSFTSQNNITSETGALAEQAPSNPPLSPRSVSTANTNNHNTQMNVKTGVPLLDRQHDRLAQLLSDATGEDGQPEIPEHRQELSVFLLDILDYAITHFEAEETAHAAINYPHYKAHQRSHKQFVDAALQWVRRFNDKNFDAEVGIKMYKYLKQWIQYHVGGTVPSLKDFYRDTDFNKVMIGASHPEDIETLCRQQLGSIPDVFYARRACLRKGKELWPLLRAAEGMLRRRRRSSDGLRDLFTQLDKDRSGTIGLEDLQEALRRHQDEEETGDIDIENLSAQLGYLRAAASGGTNVHTDGGITFQEFQTLMKVEEEIDFDSYRLGIPVLDTQNEQLLLIVALMQQYATFRWGTIGMCVTLDSLVSWICQAFHKEECLHQACLYPRATEHKESHARFVTKVSEWITSFSRGELSIDTVQEGLLDWLQHHIGDDDSEFASFLNRKKAIAAEVQLLESEAGVHQMCQVKIGRIPENQYKKEMMTLPPEPE